MKVNSIALLIVMFFVLLSFGCVKPQNHYIFSEVKVLEVFNSSKTEAYSIDFLHHAIVNYNGRKLDVKTGICRIDISYSGTKGNLTCDEGFFPKVGDKITIEGLYDGYNFIQMAAYNNVGLTTAKEYVSFEAPVHVVEGQWKNKISFRYDNNEHYFYVNKAISCKMYADSEDELISKGYKIISIPSKYDNPKFSSYVVDIKSPAMPEENQVIKLEGVYDSKTKKFLPLFSSFKSNLRDKEMIIFYGYSLTQDLWEEKRLEDGTIVFERTEVDFSYIIKDISLKPEIDNLCYLFGGHKIEYPTDYIL